SEEHTSELQSRPHLVCRLLLEKKHKSRIVMSFPYPFLIVSRPFFATPRRSHPHSGSPALFNEHKQSGSSSNVWMVIVYRHYFLALPVFNSSFVNILLKNS